MERITEKTIDFVRERETKKYYSVQRNEQCERNYNWNHLFTKEFFTEYTT